MHRQVSTTRIESVSLAGEIVCAQVEVLFDSAIFLQVFEMVYRSLVCRLHIVYNKCDRHGFGARMPFFIVPEKEKPS